MKELTCFLVLIIMIVIYMNYIRKKLYLSKVKSRLTTNLLTLLNSIKTDNRDGVKRLIDKFDPNQITENIPGSMYVAYSVNKGDELSICIREKETEKFIDMNTILFVAIHELAHIMSKSTGHTKEFWNNMNYLLKEAIKIGIYHRVNYKETPVDYCGMEINNTPLNME